MLFGGLSFAAAGALIIVLVSAACGRDRLERMAENGDFTVRFGENTLHVLDGAENIAEFGSPDGPITFFSMGRLGGSDYSVEHVRIASKDNVKNLSLKFGAGEFAVEESEDDNIYVTIHGSHAFRYGVDESHTLYVEPEKGLGSRVNGSECVLYLPREIEFEKVTLEVGAGALTMPYMTADTLELSLGAGEIEIASLQARETVISVGTGEIDIQNGQIDVLNMTVAAGQMDYQGSIGESCVATFSMGELNMQLDGEEEDFDYDLDCSAGEMQIGSMSSSGVSFHREIDEGRDKKITVSCSMGDVNVMFDGN